ncbi:MAG: hypothetical protein CM15mV149_070 [uncultured marine virus]|nr:MAG: hypothetical protein CM15mV149_070 [uncultured marine virus]
MQSIKACRTLWISNDQRVNVTCHHEINNELFSGIDSRL